MEIRTDNSNVIATLLEKIERYETALRDIRDKSYPSDGNLCASVAAKALEANYEI